MIRARVNSARLRAGFKDQVRFGACSIEWAVLPKRGDGGVRLLTGRPVTVDRFALNHAATTGLVLRMGGKELSWPADRIKVSQQADGTFAIRLQGKELERDKQASVAPEREAAGG